MSDSVIELQSLRREMQSGREQWVGTFTFEILEGTTVTPVEGNTPEQAIAKLRTAFRNSCRKVVQAEK